MVQNLDVLLHWEGHSDLGFVGTGVITQEDSDWCQGLGAADVLILSLLEEQFQRSMLLLVLTSVVE